MMSGDALREEAVVMRTDNRETDGPVTAGRRPGIEVVVLVVAVLAVLPYGFAGLGITSHLAQVDPTNLDLGLTRPRDPVGLGWVGFLLYGASVALLLAGLPLRGRPWHVARGSVRGAVVQAIGGLVIAAEWFAVHHATFYFSGPGDDCTYAGCWPLTEQTAALAVPGVLTGVVMLVMAALVHRVPWMVRAAVPAVVFVATVVGQYLVWNPYLLPVFEGPPR